jgi:flagellar biosynthesis/type III secretory pathway M-ring protein FliF/YscJ
MVPIVAAGEFMEMLDNATVWGQWLGKILLGVVVAILVLWFLWFQAMELYKEQVAWHRARAAKKELKRRGKELRAGGHYAEAAELESAGKRPSP